MDTNVLLILGMAAYGAFLWFLLYHEIHIFSHDIDKIVANQTIIKRRLENLSNKVITVYLAKDSLGEYIFFEEPSRTSNRWVCVSEKMGYVEIPVGEIQRLTGQKLLFQDAPIKFLLPCQ